MRKVTISLNRLKFKLLRRGTSPVAIGNAATSGVIKMRLTGVWNCKELIKIDIKKGAFR